MTRTLLGIDLDESPVGGLIERLLDDEDLRKLTDGGVDPDTGDDGVTERSPDDPTSPRSAPASESPTTGLDDDEADSTGRISTALGGARKRLPGGGPSDTSPTGPEAEPEEVDEKPLVTRIRRGLLFVSVGAVGLAVLAALLRRVLGRFEPEAEGEEPADDERSVDAEERPDAIDELADDAEDESTLGPVLGLAFLTLVAALVRKFAAEGDAAADAERESPTT
ncbi:hypothetical protein VB773_17815 [Haloarculaceae archaeon H-GB2-1]|nr:hypothetical protein [Haloarculaceae archaeon H-GB1-1]MEA5387753.1 hypothetical protein [Haloarculaceae archaeon H-GB11]MEA5409245.1 hypothetical protein [Haloarculaceae archaeon H-GB2-1]